jgi:transposase
MDEREQQRKVRHRLAVLRHAEEVTGSVAATCRYYGITRQCFYKWRRRYEEEGEAGLRDRSSAPFHYPNETPTEIVGKILYLRQHYHFGPLKISMYLKRYHDIEIGHSGVYRVSRGGRGGLRGGPVECTQVVREHIDSVEWNTDPPVDIGSAMTFVARFLGRRLEYTYEVVEFTTTERLVMRTQQGPFPMETSYTWAPASEAGTRMTLRNRGEPAGHQSASRATAYSGRPVGAPNQGPWRRHRTFDQPVRTVSAETPEKSDYAAKRTRARGHGQSA